MQAYKSHMYHPTYAWMFFNWYLDNWWLTNSSCVLDGSVEGESLEKVVINSLVFDHYPRIEEKRKEELNQGNILVNIIYVTRSDKTSLIAIKILSLSLLSSITLSEHYILAQI